ncbi:MAG: CoA-binding protein [Alphaproteobacteria bacterium]|nr:CoA-binding protein [Alphaproteobacteria bacterium]
MSNLPETTQEFNHELDFYSDSYIKYILDKTQHIALVGASDKPHRASFGVMRFLQDKGFKVTPVSPRLSGKTLLGETVYATLADIPERPDLVDIFMNSNDAGSIMDQAIEIKSKFIWLQLEIVNFDAATRAEKNGLKVVMNRCPAIEIPRLGWERKR